MKPFVFLICLTLLTAPTLASASTRFALVLGNNIGDKSERPLKWAIEDASRVHKLLTELANVPAHQAFLLKDASIAEFRETLNKIERRASGAVSPGERTELIFFYSGHGDSTSLHMGSERLPIKELKAAIAATKTSTTISIVDACRTTGIRDKGATHAPAFEISLSREASPKGHVFIFSAGADEIAQESDFIQGSFFSHHMLSGLRGAADADQDGSITLAEFYRYTYNTTLATSHAQTAAVQHPEIAVILEGEGEIVLTVVEAFSSRLILPPTMEGDFLIVDDENAQVVAQVQKPYRKTVTLALPRGRFRVQQRNNGQTYAGEVDLQWGGTVRLTEWTMEYQKPMVVAEKGHRIDPDPWLISGRFLLGSPAALGENFLIGGAFRLERDWGNWFALCDVHLGGAAAGNPTQEYRHLEGRAGLGLGYRFHLGPVRPSLGIHAGVLAVWEYTRRLAPGITRTDPEEKYRYNQSAIGGYLSPEIGAQVAIWRSLSVVLSAQLQLGLIPIEGELSPIVGWLTTMGFGYQF